MKTFARCKETVLMHFSSLRARFGNIPRDISREFKIISGSDGALSEPRGAPTLWGLRSWAWTQLRRGDELMSLLMRSVQLNRSTDSWCPYLG